jgi:hypothetical protein
VSLDNRDQPHARVVKLPASALHVKNFLVREELIFGSPSKLSSR